MKWISTLLILLLFVSAVQATTLSITSTDYINFSEDVQSNAWQVILRGDNDAEYIAEVPAADITGQDKGQPVKAEYGFQLDSKVLEESCDYAFKLNDDYGRTKEYTIKKEADNVFGWKLDDIYNQCSEYAKRTDQFWELAWAEEQYIFPSFLYDVYCVYSKEQDYIGTVDEGIMQFRSEFNLKNDIGQTVTKEIGSLNVKSKNDISSQVQFDKDGKTIASIRWIGGATYGETCPGQDEFLAIQDVNNKWYTVSKVNFIDYKLKLSQLESFINEIENQGYAPGEQQRNQLQTLITETSQAKQKLLREKPITSPDGTIADIEGASASLTLPPDHLIYAPDFQMLISADFLNVVYLVGKPEITDARFLACAEGSEANELSISVKNSGTTTGNFILDVNCDAGISISASQRNLLLEPGKAETFTIPFTVNLLNDAKRSCTAIVKDSINSNNKDATSFSADCQSTSLCSPDGTTRCVGEQQQICQEGNWISTESTICKQELCDFDGVCEVDLGETFTNCGGKTEPKNDCDTCNSDGICDATETIFCSDCEMPPPPPPWYNTWIYVAIGGAAAFVVWFIITELTKPKKKIGKRKPRRKKK